MHIRWLALILTGACTTAASAQAPYPYFQQPYPVHPYAQPAPQYVMQPVAPRANFPQPQPRVMYVPATPATWPVAAAPTSAVVAAPHGVGPVFVVDGPAAKTTAKPVPAANVSRRKKSLADDLNADGSAGAAIESPEAEWHGDAPVAPAHPEDDHTIWLPKGSWNFQWLGGVYSDIGDASYNWAQTSLRLGKVCSGEHLSNLCGAFETLLEFNGAATIDSGFGNYFVGSGLILRYNFVTPGSRVVPYAQLGVGFQYNDAYRDDNQSYLGSRMELTGQGQLGLRLFVTKRFSLDLEGGYQHISNLAMGTRDDAINALGGMAGMTWFFPCGHR